MAEKTEDEIRRDERAKILRSIEDVRHGEFTVSAYTGMTGQIEACKRLKEEIVRVVRRGW